METSLHRQLKEVYAVQGSQVEAPLGTYRIDVLCGSGVIEIQLGSLAAIRDKIRDLLVTHRVVVVKPIVHRKQLLTLAAKAGPVVRRRLSPRRGREIDVFDELVFFTRVFPHPNLTVEVLLVDIEEWRYPGHARRRRRRRDRVEYVVQDQRLVGIHGCLRLRSAADLVRLVPDALPAPFHSGHLAAALNAPRRLAQRIAYCLRETGAVTTAGKQGNAWLYEITGSTAGGRVAPRVA